MNTTCFFIDVREAAPGLSGGRAVLEALDILRRELHSCEFLGEVLGVQWVLQLGFVGWRKFFLLNCFPVDALKPRMMFYLVGIRTATETFFRILLKELRKEIACGITQEREVKAWVVVLNVLVEFFSVFGIERRETAEHLIDDGTKGPPVGGLAVTLSHQYLG